MTNNFDANSWEFTQRIIRIGHNRRVKKYFRDIDSDTNTNTGRAAIKTALLIRDNDSAIECLNKQLYFQNNLDNTNLQPMAVYPEDYQVRPEVSRPQLIVIFKPIKKSISNDQYSISIPHYNGNRTPNIKGYTKGNFWARAVLKDNSHIIVNARSRTESITLIKKLLRLTNPKLRTSLDAIKIGEYVHRPFKVIRVSPVRADYFPKGKLSPYPKWQHFFN